MNHLDRLEAQSVYILREAFNRIDKLAMLWSLGKDSNVMVWLAKKAFFGHVPFPVMHIDTEKKFPEMYAFRDRYVTDWKLNLIADKCPPVEEMDPTLPPAARSAARKTVGLRNAIERYGFNGIIAGIRRDEEAVRAKERVFSPRGESGQWDFRDQPPEFWDYFNTDLPPGTHLRVHPLLHWTEMDIWRYIARENIPMVELYFARTASAIARSATRTSRSRSTAPPTRSKRSSPSWSGPRRRSARAAPWTARPKTRSSGCAPPAICEARPMTNTLMST